MLKYIAVLLLAAAAVAQEPTVALESTLTASIASGAKLIRVTGSGSLEAPLTLPDGVQVVCEPGVVITWTKPGNGFQLTGNNRVENCELVGTHGPDDLAVNETGPHGIHARGVADVQIVNVTVRGWHGDGIYLGPGQNADGRKPCTDWLIHGTKALGNRRQGLTIVSGVDVLVHDSEFSDTIGAAPQSGVDVEPSAGGDRASNIVFRRCHAQNNGGSAFTVSLGRLNQTSQPVSVTFEGCTFSGLPTGHQPFRIVHMGSNEVGLEPIAGQTHRDRPPGYVRVLGAAGIWGTVPEETP